MIALDIESKVLPYRLNADLRVYRRRGAANAYVHDLEALLITGRALSDQETETGKVEDVVTVSIDAYGPGTEHWNAARHWFGLSAESRELGPTERAVLASGAFKNMTYSYFRTHRAQEMIDFLAHQIARRYRTIV